MSTTVKYGKLYMKDASGNLVQIIPEASNNISNYQGATASASGISGLVPAPQSSERNNFLKGDGTWSEIELPTGTTVAEIQAGSIEISKTVSPKVVHDYVVGELSGKADVNHNQASDTINAMTGYSKPGSSSAISTSDTLNQALGKLEYKIDSDVVHKTGNETISGTKSFSSAIDGSITGNASSATEFSATKSVTLTGDVTGSASSKAGWSVSTSLSNSGVTAGSYGPSDNATPAHSGKFNVPYITVDAKGRVTNASTKEITLPASGNTDTKVNVTLGTTTKAYLLGTSTTPTSTATGVTAIADTGVYLDTTAGKLTATTFVGSLSGNASSATEFSANKSVALTGDVTGSASSKAGWSVATTLANSGVTAGSYGPSANDTPGYGSTFNVPYFTVDAKGRVTAASTKTVKIPASDNTDSKVRQVSGTVNSDRPILVRYNAADESETDNYTVYNDNATINTSTGTLSVFGSFLRKNLNVTKGTNPSSTQYWTLTFCDKDGGNYTNNCIGMFETSLDSSGVVKTYMRAMKNTAATATPCDLAVIYDTANNTGYTQAPTPDTADNSTKIATTAFVKSQGYLTSHQSLSNYVTLNGEQTISAVKTFTAKPVLNQVGLDMTVKDTTEGSTTTRTSQVLHANSSNSAYGINIAFCSGGNAVVGGGEAGTAQLNALAGNTGEDLYLVADGSIYFKPNGNTWANAKTITLNNSAELSGLAKVTSTSFVGDLTGNASTAAAFSAAKSVTLTGDVTGTASSTAGWSVTAKRRSCLLGQSGSTTTNPWYKVATYAITAANEDVEITFLVENTYSSHVYGILKIHLRSDGSKVLTANSCTIVWLSHTGFTLADFVLVLPTAASSTAELWTKIATGYMYRRFTVLSEGGRSTSGVKWTLLDASSAGQSESITTTGTQKTSTLSGQSASCTGNAATATEFSENKSVALTGDVTGSASSKAGWSVATTLANSGVTAGSYGPSAAASPAHGGKFNVPYITVDAKGRVTAASTKEITLPASGNTDTKVNVTLGTTTKAYLLGTSTTPTSTAAAVTAISDTGVYLDTTAGKLTATTFAGALSGNASSATEFSANKSVALTGDVTGSASSKAGWSVATTLANSGVTAGSYGPSANASPAHSGKFNVPYITVDAKGRVTAAATKEITLPADNNTDTKVNVTLGTTTKAYLLGTSTTPTSTAAAVTAIADTGVYLDTTAGRITATSFNGLATKATGDADGNAIKTTYAKLASPALTGTPTAPTAALGTNTTQLATTAFVYQNAARILNADTTIYVAQAAAGTGDGSSAGNAMTTDNMWKYLASVRMVPAANGRENSRTLTIRFVPNGTTSYGNITFDANKMPGVKYIVVDTSTGTASTTSNYTTNCPTFGTIIVTGGPLQVTLKNVYSTGTIQAEMHGRVVVNTFAGAAKFVSTTYGRMDIGNGIYPIKNAGMDYLARSDTYGMMLIVTKTANFHFMEQCYFTGGIYLSDTNARMYVRHDYIKLTGTKPIVTLTASGTKTGTCATAAGTAAKVVTLESDQTFTLATNAVAYVTFSNTNTAANPTLNINSTGAKPIYFNSAAIPAAYINKHVQYKFTYNGTQYVCNNTFNRVEVASTHSFFQRNGAAATTYNSGEWNWTGYTTSFTNGANVAGTVYGSLSGNSSTTTKLATARSLTTKLDSTTAVTFDGSAAQDAIPVTGTLPIANGGTGATSRLNAIKALVNENVSTNTTHFLGLKSDWSKVGYISVADAKTVLGLGTAAYSSADAFATAAHTHSYLPLAGGSITGSIKLDSTSTTGVYKGNATSIAEYSGGSALTKGARLALYGESHSSAAGKVDLIAANASTAKHLILLPDGTATWNGASIQTSSDKRLKTELTDVSDEILNSWENVQWGQFKYLESISTKGNSARLHLGLIAQDIKLEFDNNDLDICEYGILCHEEHEPTEEEPAVDLWMVRYTEALCMEAAYQRRKNRTLENRISELETQLASVLNRLKNLEDNN